MGFNSKILADIHVGNIISTWLKKNIITKSKFAEIMELPKTNAGRLLSNKSMELSKLVDVCKRLQHNFIADICEEPKYVGYLEFAPLNIGRTIETRLKILNMTQVEFAKLMGIYQSDVSKLLKKESISTDKLIKISLALDHNFFRELLPMDFSNPDVYDSALKDATRLALDMVDNTYAQLNKKDEEISNLKKQNDKLKKQITKLQRKNTELRKLLDMPISDTE